MAGDQTGGSVEHESDEAIAAKHPAPPDRVIRVAPTDDKKETTNTVRVYDPPAACWRLEDICFDFASVFLLEESKKAFEGLLRIWKKESLWGKPPVLALFGHADPIGDDEFNKQLSEDRAAIVHAVLVRDASVWKTIFERRSRCAPCRRA